MRLLVAAVLPLLAVALTPTMTSAQIPSAITTDPAPDVLHPATIRSFQLPSHGAQLNALMYLAAGAGPHPTILLLHGFPGNEKNLDLAQAARRAGYNVLYFNYRGSWGSPGQFSFTHCIEDVNAAIAYLRDPANAVKLRVDPGSLILIGHSMGGFMARYVAAHDPGIKAVVLLSAADMGNDRIEAIRPEERSRIIDSIAHSYAAEGLAALACKPRDLAEEAVANADAWNIPNVAARLAARPILVITSDDGLLPSNNAFVAALRRAGATHVSTVHLATDHVFSDRRIALQTSVLNWLAES